MAYRTERCEKIILRSLQESLYNEARNPLLQFVSITKVSLNKDLSVAQVWFTVMGSDAEKEATSKALDEAKGYLRSLLAKDLDLRKTPELRFKYDTSLEYGNHIEEMLNEINNK